MIIGFLKYRKPRPPRRQRQRAFMSVTQLEMRLAPATLAANAMDVTYLDEHNQLVDVHINQPVFTSATIANEVFTFKYGSGVNGSNAIEQQLQEIDLTQLTNLSAAPVPALTITVTSPVTAQPIEVGLINAPGIDLGAVTVQGDLGAINAGAADTNPGLASLTVESMGQYGTATQPPGGGLVSTIQGPLGALTVSVPKGSTGTGNIDGEFINVNGTIGPVIVTGSLIGGKADYSGEISASGDMGDMGGVKVGGSLEGGAGFGTGEIYTGGNLGPVTIGGSVMGSAGNASGSIITDGNLTSVKVGGALDGGMGDYSGEIGSDVFATGNVGPVQIGGNVVGSGGNYSGSIFAGGNLTSVTVVGALEGGAGGPSGAIFAIGNITGQVQIGKGVQGSTGLYSGSILADGTLAATSSVTVGGALSGGAGDYSGVIVANDALGQVTIVGNVVGSGGEGSGEVGSFGGSVAGVTVGSPVSPVVVGSVGGGTGSGSGEIFSDTGTLGPVKITGNLLGGSVSGSGFIFGAHITSVSITGSVIAGQNTGTGRLTDSGAISATYDIGPITVGSLVGNSKNPVVISARGQNPTTLSNTSTTDVAIASITVTGSVSFTNILAGYNPAGTGINAAAQIGAVTVGGNWTASNLVAGAAPGPDGLFGTADDVVLGSSDAPSTVTSQIGAIVIKGTVAGNVKNPSAHYGFVARQVTSLKVGLTAITLITGPDNDHLVPVGNSGKVTVNEV